MRIRPHVQSSFRPAAPRAECSRKLFPSDHPPPSSFTHAPNGGGGVQLPLHACSHDGNGRAWTVSIAVPGSIIDNTQNLEFATFVAGQIARTAAIFNVDEVGHCPTVSCGVAVAK